MTLCFLFTLMLSLPSELLHRGTCRLTAPLAPLIESLTFSTPPTTPPPPSSPSPQPFICLCATAGYGTAQPAELCCALIAFSVVNRGQWCCGVPCPVDPHFSKKARFNKQAFHKFVVLCAVVCMSLFFVTNKPHLCYYCCVYFFMYVFKLFCLPRFCYMYYNDYYMKLLFDLLYKITNAFVIMLIVDGVVCYGLSKELSYNIQALTFNH